MSVAGASSVKPIIFSGPMVRAILDGRKTQTRRVVKRNGAGRAALGGKNWHLDDPNAVLACPYGRPGDLLWVRESHHITSSNQVIYRADYPANAEALGLENIPPESAIRWRPSIHMARYDCRLWLRVTDLRVQRVQEISEDDCAAEGMTPGLCEQVLNAAAGKLEPEEAYYVDHADDSGSEGWLCHDCAEKARKYDDDYIHWGCCPESDGPAYCDECQKPLIMSLTEYGIDRELLLENDDPSDVQHFAAKGLDAAIAGMIAGGIGDLKDRQTPRLLKIGFATLWDSINGKRPGCSWADNPWVWAITFEREGPNRADGAAVGGGD